MNLIRMSGKEETFPNYAKKPNAESFCKGFALCLLCLWPLHALAHKDEVTNHRLLQGGLRQPVVLIFVPLANSRR